MFFRMVLILGALFSFTTAQASARDLVTITRLKDLHLTTSLVEKGKTRAVIVAPAGERYRADIDILNQRIRTLTGLTLPVIRDDGLPEELLRRYHVITLGNMATNAFIEKLYQQWQVILDLKYPGQGGYVVRSLHSPYATGHNVIFLGGSDDAGVKEAVHLFANGLKGKSTLKVGRLMHIKLGAGFTLPVISADQKKWDLRSWNDSWRKNSAGRESGYPAATFFGWNPISIAGVLYYMTGERQYLDLFRELALPGSAGVSAVISASDAFTDPSNPLVKNYHYRAHLLDCIYDLIEESPLLSDDERLKITSKLMEHQFDLDPNSSFSKPLGDRHATWHMLCIYTGSRYFSRYYPGPLWERRIANVRKAYASFNNDPTWGGQEDTLNWVATFIEPLFEFALLDGSAEFVQSGAARTYMRGLETLMSGDDIDDYNFFLPHNLLFKAAWLLKDSRYRWMANRLGVDFSKFRIGQSYWPAPEADVTPPLDLIGSVSVAPLSRVDREKTETPVSPDQGFQLLSYRSGLDKDDDFLLLDGFAGAGRHPFQLNTLLRLRMFNGKNILSGNASDLSVVRNGMADPHVARSAALTGQLATKDFAALTTEVTDMPGSHWQRRILYLKGLFTVVVDRVTAREAGRFDVVSSWELGSGVKPGIPSRRIVASNGAVLSSAELPYQQLATTVVQGSVSRELGRDESIVLANLFSSTSSPRAISPLNRGGYLISGSRSAFVGTGPVVYPGFSVQAGFCYLDSERLLLEGATALVVQGRVLFSSDTPVSLYWDFKQGTARFSTPQPARVRLATAGSTGEIFLGDGESVCEAAAPLPELSGQLRTALGELDPLIVGPLSANGTATASQLEWQPLWEHALKGKITAMAKAGGNLSGGVWAVTQDNRAATIARIDENGKLKQSVQQQGELLSIRPADGEKQTRAFALLAGFRDDMLRAYGENGQQLWAVKAAIHPSFLIGDHYEAPWFTNPGPPNNMTGVYSILVGDFWNRGKEETAIGRPSTVEFRSLDGTFISSTPTRWGTTTALALVKSGAAGGSAPLLLAGKGYAGNPSLSGINGQYKTVSDGLYDRILPEFTNMHSWLMRGLTGVQVTDVNGDGADEIIYTLSGHWNELRVYDAAGNPLWMKFFGPDKKAGVPFMTALELADFDRDGRKDIIVATRLGWVIAFDHRGAQIWQRHFESGVARLAIGEQEQKIVVGCDDGTLVLLDNSGRQLAVGRMDGAVKGLVFDGDAVFAGSSTGVVRRYAVPR